MNETIIMNSSKSSHTSEAAGNSSDTNNKGHASANSMKKLFNHNKQANTVTLPDNNISLKDL